MGVDGFIETANIEGLARSCVIPSRNLMTDNYLFRLGTRGLLGICYTSVCFYLLIAERIIDLLTINFRVHLLDLSTSIEPRRRCGPHRRKRDSHPSDSHNRLLESGSADSNSRCCSHLRKCRTEVGRGLRLESFAALDHGRQMTAVFSSNATAISPESSTCSSLHALTSRNISTCTHIRVKPCASSCLNLPN